MSSIEITHFFCFKFVTLFVVAKSLSPFKSRVALKDTHLSFTLCYGVVPPFSSVRIIGVLLYIHFTPKRVIRTRDCAKATQPFTRYSHNSDETSETAK